MVSDLIRRLGREEVASFIGGLLCYCCHKPIEPGQPVGEDFYGMTSAGEPTLDLRHGWCCPDDTQLEDR